MLLQYQPFQLQNPPNMTTLATKDVASQEIVDDILSVFDRGVTFVKEFIDQRLNGSINDETSVGFHEALKKKQSKTFAALYKASAHTKTKTSKLIEI